MRTNAKLPLSLIAIVVAVMFSACTTRYGHLTRRVDFSKKKQHPTFHSGHYVRESPANTPEPAVLATEIQKKETISSVPPAREAIALPPVQHINRHNQNLTPPDTLVERPSKDTVMNPPDSKARPDSKLYHGSITAFSIAAATNLALVSTARFNFMALALLLGLGLVVVGYFIGKLVTNMADNNTHPPRGSTPFNASREQLKRVVQIFFLTAVSLFVLSLMVALLQAFELATGLLILGLIAFWAGVLGGITYLLMGI